MSEQKAQPMIGYAARKVSATEIPLRFVLYGLQPSADALSLG